MYCNRWFPIAESQCGIEFASFPGRLVVYVLDWSYSEKTSVHAGGFCPANVETFDPRTDYRSGTRIRIRRYFVEKWEERLYV